MYPYIHHSAFMLSGQDMETTKVPFVKLLNKETVVHIHTGILMSYEKILNTAICDKLDGLKNHHAR